MSMCTTYHLPQISTSVGIWKIQGTGEVDLNLSPLFSVQESAEKEHKTKTESRNIRRQTRQICLRRLTDLVSFTGR